MLCFHCNKPLNIESVSEAQACINFDGRSEACCSEQCAVIAQGIIEKNLGEFYRHRISQSSASQEINKNDLNWASFERPAVMREFVNSEADGTLRAELLIQGVHCGACTWLIERALADQPGIVSIQVNPATTRGSLRWNPAKARLGGILESIAALGYTPVPFTEAATEAAGTQEYRIGLRRLVVAGLGMMQVMSYAVALYSGALEGVSAEIGQFLRIISLLVATPVVLYSGAPFFRNAWNNIRSRSIGMDVPVSLAIAAAYAVSVWHTLIGSGEVYFDSATMFVFFLSATRFLEMSGRHKALSLTGAMARHLPKTAMRVSADGTEIVGVMELIMGDRVLVQPGQAFPADGTLDDDSARVDESLLTGESEPVNKQRNSEVVAGSVNLKSAVHMRVDKVGAETVIAGIGRMVTEAREHKPRLVQLADKVGGWFVTAMLLVAAITAGVWYNLDPTRAFEVTLAVLVVTCPCALALATPAAFSVALSNLARHGLLLRRPGALQSLVEVDELIFDKTGTLTTGQFTIQNTECFGDLSAESALSIAAQLEHYSEHPIARAFPFTTHASAVSDVVSVASAGLEGRYSGKIYRIGTAEFVTALGDGDGAALQYPTDDSKAIFLGSEAGLLARFDIAEYVRPDARYATDALHARGLRLSIASGDHKLPVERLAEKLHIENWHAAMKAADKLELVRQLQATGRKVAVVGDGINDSPVLAGADVSIAMGGGTSLAQHSADCILMSNSLSTLNDGFRLAEKTMRIVKQNLIWAAAYNLTAIPLAATGLLAPWMAALGMSLSSLLVTLNALRLGSDNMFSTNPAMADSSADTNQTTACCMPKPAEETSCCASKKLQPVTSK